ncbi:MAG: ribosome maturation factor RimP [Mycobacterium sp.]|nr:ribosome maturation factor RimP [Mycobacterium sp.]
MASDVPLRSARLPSQQQVIEILGGEFARVGYEIEDVLVEETAKPPRIVVVADADEGLDLDAVAELARSASELLDRLDETAPYVLEVTSPGVDRPLTSDRHFRRARGRRVELTLSDGSQLTGRLGELGEGILRLVMVAEGRPGNYTVREVPRDAVTKAVVQVEFSPPNRRELELSGGQERSESGIGSGQSEKEAKA